MKKILLLILLLHISFFAYSQVVKSDELFTEVTTFDGKVVFLKEIAFPDHEAENVYDKLKLWAKPIFMKDANSTLRYDYSNKELRIISRIELILPVNSKGEREKVQMKYKMNVFSFQNKCVMEVKGISYAIKNSETNKSLAYKAEDVFMTNTFTQEFKDNLTKSTTYYLNQLAEGISKELNN